MITTPHSPPADPRCCTDARGRCPAELLPTTAAAGCGSASDVCAALSAAGAAHDAAPLVAFCRAAPAAALLARMLDVRAPLASVLDLADLFRCAGCAARCFAGRL